MNAKKIIAAALIGATALSIPAVTIMPQVAYAKADKTAKAKAQAFYTGGLECIKNKDIRTAAESFMEAGKLDEENPLYALFAGDMLSQLKQYPAAIREYERAVKYYKEGPKKQKDKIRIKAWLGLSDAYRKTNDAASAKEYSKLLIYEYPEDYRGFLALGRVYAMNKETYPEAIVTLKKSIDLKKDQLPAYLTLASIYSKQGQKDKIVETYEQACDYRPLDESMKMSLAQVYFSYKDDGVNHYKDAIRVLKSIIDVNRSNAFAHYYLALAYTLEGEQGQAEKELSILTSLDKSLADKLYHEIRAYNKKHSQEGVTVDVSEAKDGEVITIESGAPQTENLTRMVESQIARMETNAHD